MRIVLHIIGFLGCAFLGSHNYKHHLVVTDDTAAGWLVCSRCGREK